MASRNSVNRRDFMRQAAKVAAGVTVGASAVKTARADVFKSILPPTIVGANEVIRTGHIGTGIMGKGNLGYILRRDDMLPVVICDIWPEYCAQALQMAQAKNPAATSTANYEEIIANPDVDAIVVATPDHWHALPAIQGLAAGKAVYCEKPMTTTIVEAQAVLKAAKASKAVFNGGTLQRSGECFREAAQMIRDGYIGDVFHVETSYHDSYLPMGLGPSETTPKPGCDWIRHQGWVKQVPFDSLRWLYSFRFFFDYAGGRLTDWGVHLVDIAMWALGENEMPKSVAVQGGKFVIKDGRTTPDTFDALWEFGKYTISFSHRACNAYPKTNGDSHGIIFHGVKGTLELSRAGYKVYPQERKKKSGEVVPLCEAKEFKQVNNLYELHWANFADSVHGTAQPDSPVQSLYNSTVTCHMATCAYIAGGKLHWDAAAEKFIGEDEIAKKANDWANRPYENGYTLA